MLAHPTLREWITSLTIGSFAVTALTGALCFFHLAQGPVRLAHEWLSWLFVVSGLGHMVLNWRACAKVFGRPGGRVVAGACLVLFLSAFLPFNHDEKKVPVRQLLEGLTQVPISTLATVTRASAEEILARLRTQGLRVQGEEQTLRAVAQANGRRSLDILRIAVEQDARR